VVSACGAIDDIYERHRVVATAAEAAAMAVRAGTDLSCGSTYRALVAAVDSGLVPENLLDTALVRLFTARFRLGMFDPPDSVPWAATPMSAVDQPAYRALALRAARESIVLLKNRGRLLPLRPDLRTVAVIGPDADDPQVPLGNYNGSPSDTVTPLRGIRAAVSPTTRVVYARGSDLVDTGRVTDDTLIAAAVSAARGADAVILCLGLSPRLEGEEMRVDAPGFRGGDRVRIDLPDAQQRLLRAIVALKRPTVLVLLSGSAVAIPWAARHVPAIVETWYGGEAAGTALADVLFGGYDPGGRLPVTVYRDTTDLPPFDDYSMAGRTYRFFGGTALYPFGFGLSYATFRYAHLTTDAPSYGPEDTIRVSFDVTNTGTRAGDEVAQLYVRHLASAVPRPREDLRGFGRLTLQPGETRTVSLRVPVASLAYWDQGTGRWIVESERVELRAGASSADIRQRTTIRIVSR